MSAVSTCVSMRPNFSGIWQPIRSEGLAEYLQYIGVPVAIIPNAIQTSLKIKQHIKHTKTKFTIETNDSTTVYSISNSNDELDANIPNESIEENKTSQDNLAEELIGNSMMWDGDELVVCSALSNSETKRGYNSQREEMWVTNSTDNNITQSWFKRVQSI
jgi:hypothetical protein